MFRFQKYTPVVVFIIFFAFGLSLAGYFNYIYVKHILKLDSQQLLYRFEDTYIEARKLLASMPTSQNIECNKDTVKMLARLSYNYPSVRLLGYQRTEKYCTSEPIPIDLSKYHKYLLNDKNGMSEIYYLASVKNPDKSTDLLLLRSYGEVTYFVSLNPFAVDYLTDFACKKCLEYDFFFEGPSKLEFRSPQLNDTIVIEHKSSLDNNGINVTLYVRGSKKLYHYYSELSWLTAIIVSTIGSLVFALLTKRYIATRYSFKNALIFGLENREFIPYFQPIVDCRNGEVVGAEVLARWHRQDGTTISPAEFIPFAETSGLIIDITEQLVYQTARAIKTLGWDKSEKFMSINIVPKHLQQKQLYQVISQLSHDLNIPAKSFSLEITERMEIKNLSQARENLEDFYQQGIQLKLDDAGTGYGGFSYIQELGVSSIKIDKMFIDTIGREDVKASVLDAIISFAKTSGLEIIAEGVEHKEQEQYLQNEGVHLIQGYIYAKPMSLKELVIWLDTREVESKEQSISEYFHVEPVNSFSFESGS